MSERRTLEELKLLLSASRAAESDLLSLILPLTGDAAKGGFGHKALRDYEYKVGMKSGKFPKPKRDEARGILGHGSVADLEKAYPEFKKERDRLIAIEEKANRKKAKLVAAPERRERTRKGAANPFERGRRRLVAQQLQQLRGSPEGRPGAGRQAAKFEILRLLSERPKHTNNPLLAIADQLKGVKFDDYFDEHMMDRIPDAYDYAFEDLETGKSSKERYNPPSQKEMAEEASRLAKRDVEQRRSDLEGVALKQKSQITPYRLRRMTDADLDRLLSAGFSNPRITALLLDEKRMRLADAYNRNVTRRDMNRKLATGAVKPSSLVPASTPGGSGGQKVARTFLRLLTRGR
ncbi:MAG: hypothetical protein CMH52_02975 [Myxococcales bacterium]|nr:hypothetical protein [Myxococcales bacterium]